MIRDPARPNDVRGFIHKRLLGAAKGLVTSGFNPLAAVSGFVGGGGAGRAARVTGGPSLQEQAAIARGARVIPSFVPIGGAARRPPPRTLTARPSVRSAAEKEVGRAQKFGGTALAGGPCRIPGQRVDPCTGNCDWFIGNKPGRDDEPCPGNGGAGGGGGPVGEAVMGQYGAALQPGSLMVDRAVCLRGMQLGNDGLCYNKGAISNRQRMWPAGRKPLLSGGDMRAISIAARAGRRLEGATKRLQKIGLMKKPTRRAVTSTRGRGVHPAVDV